MAPKLVNLTTVSLRIISALVLGVAVISALYIGSPLMETIVVLVTLQMLREWNMVTLKLNDWTKASVFYLSIALVVLLNHLVTGSFIYSISVLFILTAVYLWVFAKTMHQHAPFALLAGAVAIILAAQSFFELYWIPEKGTETILWLFAVVWTSDVAAYFVGSYIGGIKLLPKVSPNKTWSGLLGGLLFGTLIGSTFPLLIGGDFHPLLPVISFFVALAAQGGDLIESACKRYFGVKDMGNLIPGHGGVLDRVDSLVVAAPTLLFWVNILGLRVI